VAVRREDTGQFAMPGGMSDRPGDTWNRKMRSEFNTEVTQDKDDDPLQKQHMKMLLDQLFHGKESSVVYRGYVDEPRNTDNAWFETTACHFHCSRELGALLPLKPAPAAFTDEQKEKLEYYHSPAGGVEEAGEGWRERVKEELGLNDIFWLDINEAADAKDIYASHCDWIRVVRQRLKQVDERPGLLQLVAQWGRVDILEGVLKDPELLAQRQPMQVQMAFQGALEHAIEPNFDLKLIELLMETGAKAADVYLPALFDLKERDLFGLFADIQHRRLRRLGSRVAQTLLRGRQNTFASLPTTSPKPSPARLRLASSDQGS
jgi:hypothetical protein